MGHPPFHPWPQVRLSNTITRRHNKSTHTDKTQRLYAASIHHNVANKTWAIYQAGKYWSIYSLMFLNYFQNRIWKSKKIQANTVSTTNIVRSFCLKFWH